MSAPLFTFVVILGLLLANALFVAAEFAIVGVPRPSIERLAAHGNTLAQRVIRILDSAKRRDRYLATVAGIARVMYDRDTVPGAEPEDLMRLDVPALIVPGQDASHATSAARYLEECLPDADYWDVPVAQQTADTAPARVLRFLDAH